MLESKKIDFTKMLTENPDIKLTSNMKSLLTSGVTNYFDSKSQNYIDNNNMNKSSFTIKTQNDIVESEETNNITTNLDVTIMKVKQLETKLANKAKEAQTLQLHSQKLEKEIFQVFFFYFKIILNKLKQNLENSQTQIKEKNDLISSLQEQISVNNKTVFLLKKFF